MPFPRPGGCISRSAKPCRLRSIDGDLGTDVTWTVHDEGEGTSGDGDWFIFDGLVRGGVHYDDGDIDYAITAGNIQIHFNG